MNEQNKVTAEQIQFAILFRLWRPINIFTDSNCDIFSFFVTQSKKELVS